MCRSPLRRRHPFWKLREREDWAPECVCERPASQGRRRICRREGKPVNSAHNDAVASQACLVKRLKDALAVILRSEESAEWADTKRVKGKGSHARGGAGR